MRLCMFHPVDHPMERGWVGRIDGAHVVQLAAQTLQSFFTGGGTAREHAVFPLAGVRFLAPVLHPPSIRAFTNETTFEFRNPAAVIGHEDEISRRPGLLVELGVAAIIGMDEKIAGFTLAAGWRAAGLPKPKDRDFAFGLGPYVLTPDELHSQYRQTSLGDEQRYVLPTFDWDVARTFAAAGTRLHPGDILAGPSVKHVPGLDGPSDVEFRAEGFDALRQRVVVSG